ncbi:MAG: hypothetical protein ACTSYD_09865 [Candidatus Heimdallarchaeaceae archaeon]
MSRKISLLIVILFLTSVIALSPSTQAETGEINGIKYSHSIVTVSEQGHGYFQDHIFVDEAYKDTTIYSGYVPLITNYSLYDTLYVIVNYRYFYEYNGSELETKWIANQETMENYVTFVLSTIPPIYQDTLNVTEDLSHEVYFLSTDLKYLGSTFLNSTIIEFLDYSPILDTTFYHAIAVIPLAYLIEITTEDVYVTVNDTYYARALYGAYYGYYYEYDASVEGYYVEITDEQTFGLKYFGAIRSSVSYVAQYYCAQGFFRLLLHNVTITSTDTRFTDENGNVLYKYYPRNMLPYVIADYGEQTIAWNVSGTFETRSPLQAAIQAFVTRSTNATADHFAVWGIANPTRMIAYQDGNDNDQLDVYIDVDGNLKHDTIDWVKYVGFPEAYRTSIDVEYQVKNNYTSVVFAPGVNLNETHNFVGLEQGSTHVFYEIGNVDQEISVTPKWTEPVVNPDGSVTFAWGIDYENYPVLWYNTTDGSVIEDQETISYDYTYTVDLANGQSSLSTTGTFGGITDPQLASAMDGLSLATYQVSELLTIEKLTGSADTGTIGSYVPTGTTNVELTYSDSTELVDISMGGNKQTYHIGSNEYETNTSVINLVLVSGGVTYSNTTAIDEFHSEAESIATTLTDSQKQQTTYNWLYRKDLIIINYPTWDGKQIVHDPSFQSYFTPTAAPTPTETSTPTSTTSPTAKTPFAVLGIIFGILTVKALFSRKKFKF